MPIRHGQPLKTIEKIRLCLLAAFRRAKRSGSACSLAASIAKGICLGLMAISFNPLQVAAAENTAQFSTSDRSLTAHQVAGTRLSVETQPAVAPHPKRANFEREHKSENAQHMADWVIDSGDNRGMPFAIVDKMDAKVFVFDVHGRLRGAAPVLLGLARGDYTVPGIGDRKLSDIRPEERVTPAGRFVASLGFNLHGKDILWVDYDDAVSLHRVVTNNPREHRLERLASRKPLDHRISWGCINVPANFYNDVVKPTFTETYGIVYVMPETRSISKIFESYYDVEFRRETGTTAHLDEGTVPDLQQQDLRVGGHKGRP
jgi:hypothetical protein